MIKPFAFVLIPFSPEFDDIYKLGIKATADELGVIAERVDEQTFSETILERIYRQIDAADFIIADMTGRNPNVFYEVGYAHAKGKPYTLLTQAADDIPFDLKHHRHLIYEGSIQKLRSMLKVEIQWLKDNIIDRKSRVFDVSLKSANGILEKSDYFATGNVDLVIDIKNDSDRRSPEIDAIYFHTSDGWTFKTDGSECPSTPEHSGDYRLKHFIRSPVQRLAPGAWAQIKLKGERELWKKWSGSPLEDSYHLAGTTIFDISTSDGLFTTELYIDVEIDEIPF